MSHDTSGIKGERAKKEILQHLLEHGAQTLTELYAALGKNTVNNFLYNMRDSEVTSFPTPDGKKWGLTHDGQNQARGNLEAEQSNQENVCKAYETATVPKGKITHCGHENRDLEIHGRVYRRGIAVATGDGRLNIHYSPNQS